MLKPMINRQVDIDQLMETVSSNKGVIKEKQRVKWKRKLNIECSKIIRLKDRLTDAKK